MRTAKIERNTNETQIKLEITIDGKGVFEGETGIGFFDHMLTLFATHGKMDLRVTCQGDLQIDTHHLVEDFGIVLGECLTKALGDKRGISRYGNFTCPMDECLTTVTVDLSGRGYLVYHCELTRERVGDFECEMLEEFLYALAINGKFNLHVNNHYGKNDHHKIESIFKALARSLRQATTIESDEIPSTKGVLI